ncbi:MAG: hypothetical protein SF182_07265 [Deltaproteobacteria bacterium]|nr:hypothetical protein [Deltaproteobacteria bacterium]
MIRTLRSAMPLLGLMLGHLAFLAQGAMLGCSFTAPAGSSVDDAMDNPNFYTCACRCSAPVTNTLRVSASGDDAEQTQRLDDTDGGGDLDLGIVSAGLRFSTVVIPPGATITAANLQLTADGGFSSSNTTALTLAVFGEASDSAASFAGNFANVNGRARTTASVSWPVAAWSVGQSGAAQRSPELKTILQEIVNRPGWTAGNALVLILVQASGNGRREAESFDGNAGKAARLEVSFTVATDQALNVCMPASINPNLLDGNGNYNPAPTDMALQNDCAGRVETTLSHLASACDYPPQCECDAVPSSRKFNDSCNDPCAETPLDPTCSNFDPVHGTTTATNAPGDTPVCLASRNAALSAPAALSAGAFGQVSQCAVSGPATIEVGDESKESNAQGFVEFSGRPCPGGQCSLALAYTLDLDPITFAVRFAADPKFEDLASSGASTLAAAKIGPTGVGTVGAMETESSVRGRRKSNTKAFLMPNPHALNVIVDWDDHTCALFGTLAGTADGEQNGEEELAAEVSVSGDLLNQPPHADAGADQSIECTSPAGAAALLDGRASGDPEANLVRLSWTRDSRVGAKIATGATAVVDQGLGAPVTYVLRAIDDFGQSDEDSTQVAIVDTGKPSLALSAKPTTLLELTASLKTIKVTVTAADLCDSAPAVRLRSITTNEGIFADATHPHPDIQGAAFDTDDREFQLRATRLATSKSGRIYTANYEVKDASGNTSTQSVTVTAPKVGLLPYNPPVRR